ncbi:MAG TPA: polysaccharide biosynthesis C-terminal domain-containing protein [Candidatus Limnocylindrales bacterium]|nr:polysaccharide biosynthesis C-terminal domain-containing protein [Candidatus Limnocylindrales bacterium]
MTREAAPDGGASAPNGGAAPRGPLLRDALATIATRFGLALLIFATDIVLARLLGPSAKGRFALVLLFSQLVAVVVGWGMDMALAVVAARDRDSARRGFANALIWTAVAGSMAVIATGLLYGLPTDVRPRGPLAQVIPNLSAAQFAFAALAIPLELFFALGLYALLGRGRVIEYGAIRLLRRGLLLVAVVGAAAVARLSLDVALVINLVALGATAAAILWVARRDEILSLRPSGELMREELGFGSRAIVGTLAERLQFRADTFIVNAVVGVRATGVYSVTSGLAETLWYIPNALGVVMFSRAVDPAADSGRIAAVLTRTTIAVTIATAVPAFLLGPWLVEVVYGSDFAEAGLALRWILPGVVAYSVVAILSRYIVGEGRPGLGTAVLVAGLAANIASNLLLVPRLGIEGAALSSSLSYGATAVLMLWLFRRLSGRGFLEALVIRVSDLRALARALGALVERLTGRRVGPLIGLRGGGVAAGLVMGEHEPGEEL